MVQGRDAGRVLNSSSANEVDEKVNQITYTQWLNEHGKLEADLTVSKLTEEKYMVVATDNMHKHAETWLQRHIPPDAHAFVTDMTSAFGQEFFRIEIIHLVRMVDGLRWRKSAQLATSYETCRQLTRPF